MIQITTEQKHKIDKIILNVACANLKNVPAAYISIREKLDIDIVIKRLLQLRDDDRITINYDIVCPECNLIIKTVNNEKDIPIGEVLYCDECGEFQVEPEYILISYSPNKEYYTEDMCGVKKKIWKNRQKKTKAKAI